MKRIILFIILFLTILLPVCARAASWYDHSWLYRATVSVINSNTTTVSNLPIKLTIDTSALISGNQLRSDCGDFRLTDSDGTTLLPLYLSNNSCASTTTVLFGKATSLAAGATTYLYLYYGNATATSQFSWDQTFLPYVETQLSTNIGFPRYSADGGVFFQNKYWTMGGRVDAAAGSRRNDVWNSSDGLTWTQVTSSAAWSARQLFSALSYRNTMYIMGGTTPRTNDVWSSTDGLTWTQVTSSAAWGPRNTFGATVALDKMWVGGGFNGGYLSDLWYSDDGLTWTQATTTTWHARQAFQLIGSDNSLLLSGGTYFSGSSFFLTDSWQLMRPFTTSSPTVSDVLNPIAPTVSSVSTSSLSITIGADGNSSSIAYSIQEVNSGNFVQSNGTLSSSEATSTLAVWGTKTVSGLAPNTQYVFQVRAFDTNGATTTLSTSSTPVYTLSNVPGLPTIGTSTISSLPITIDTNNNSTSTTYAIYNNTVGTYLDDHGAATSTVAYYTSSTWNSGGGIATGLSANTRYQFLIIAKNGSDIITASSSLSSAKYTLAVAPSLVTAAANSASAITVSWSGGAASSYNIVKNNEDPITGQSSSYQYTGLSCGTSYTFKVYGVNGDGIITTDFGTVSASTFSCGSGVPSSVTPTVSPSISFPPVTSSLPTTISEIVPTETKIPTTNIIPVPLVSAPILDFVASNPDSKVVILPITTLTYKPNSLVKYTYSYKNETDQSVRVKVVRQITDVDGKVVNEMSGDRTIASGKIFKFNANNALSAKLTDGIYTVSVQVLDFKTGDLLDVNSFDIFVQKPLPPQPLVSNNPDSKIIITGIKMDYKPGDFIRYNYSYKNETAEAIRIKVIRQIVDVDGKLINKTTGTNLIPKGKTFKFNASNYLNTKLSDGEYVVEIKLFDINADQLLEENSFNVNVKR